MANSKFFRVATEGATSDGRTIERAHIEQMAATYNVATKAARINVEHVRGTSPDSPFGAYGDVLSLKTGEVDLQVGDKTEKRLALYAEIRPLPNLIALTKAGQKLYTSIEITPNFASTGMAYLAGIAVTDNNASLGVEMLQFCAGKGAASPLAARKQSPENWFTEAVAVDMDFSEDGKGLTAQGDANGILGVLKALFGFSEQSGGGAPTAQVATPPAAAAGAGAGTAPALTDPAFAAATAALLAFAEKGSAALDQLTQRQEATDTALNELKGKMERTPAYGFSHRPAATGADDAERADC